jgi:hypothetical protein
MCDYLHTSTSSGNSHSRSRLTESLPCWQNARIELKTTILEDNSKCSAHSRRWTEYRRHEYGRIVYSASHSLPLSIYFCHWHRNRQPASSATSSTKTMASLPSPRHVDVKVAMNSRFVLAALLSANSAWRCIYAIETGVPWSGWQ